MNDGSLTVWVERTTITKTTHMLFNVTIELSVKLTSNINVKYKIGKIPVLSRVLRINIIDLKQAAKKVSINTANPIKPKSSVKSRKPL